MITKNYRLTLDLSVTIDTEAAMPDPPPGIEHIQNFIKAFGNNRGELLEFYKRYIADLLGSDSHDLENEMKESLRVKNEKENYLAVASTCPAATKAFIRDMIGRDGEELRNDVDDEKKARLAIGDRFYNFILNCFHSPRICHAVMKEIKAMKI